MRWDSLFEDLESQWESELVSDELERRSEAERLRLGRLSLRERLIGLGPGGDGRQIPTEVGVVLRGGRRCTVVLGTVGRDWFSGDIVRDGAHTPPRGCVVSLPGIERLTVRHSEVRRSLHAPAQAAGPRVTERIGLPFALRDLCRRRTYVWVGTSGGGDVEGTMDRVARDHIDVAVHPADVARRDRNVSCVEIIPMSALEIVTF